MRVGDLVCRKIKGPIDQQTVRSTGKIGIITKKMVSPISSNPYVVVFWAKSGKLYNISERLVEVISEGR